MSGKNLQENQENIDRLLEIVEGKNNKEIEIGTQAWVPCAGISNNKDIRIPFGHMGRIDTYKGDGQSDKGEWVTQSQALQLNPQTIISNSPSHCPSCSNLMRENIKHP